MTHIAPSLPEDGQTNWDVPLNAALATIINKVNDLDDVTTSLPSFPTLADLGGITSAAVDVKVAAQALLDVAKYALVDSNNLLSVNGTPVTAAQLTGVPSVANNGDGTLTLTY